MTANPTNGWLKNRIYDKWQKDELPKGMEYIPAKIFDNPYIPADYLESLKMLPRYQYEVFVEGNWDIQLKTGGEFYKCFELDKHVKDLRYNPDSPLHISFDFNTKPYMTLTIYHIYNKSIYLIDEICLENPRSTTKETCREFIRKYRGHQSGLFVYGDPAGKSEDTKMEKGENNFTIIQNEFKEYRPTMRLLSKAPGLKTRGDFINDVLDRNFGGISIAVHNKCFNSINDFIGTKENSDGTKYKEKGKDVNGVAYEKFGHCTDSFDYMICKAFEQEYAQFMRGPASIDKPKIGFREDNAQHGY